MIINSSIMVVSYIIYFYSNLPSARVKNARKRSTNDTPWHVPPPPQRKSEIARLLRYGFFFRSRWRTPKTHRHLRMPSTPGVRDCSGRYRIFPARRQMHAKKNKYAMPRFDRTVAATTPVRPATRGHGRMSHNGLFRLAPRWPSESAHRRYAPSDHSRYL